MNEIISLQGITFDRCYFHSASLARLGDDVPEQYRGNLVLKISLVIPNINKNQAIMEVLSHKGSTPIETIDLYLLLLDKLRNCVTDAPMGRLPDRGKLIDEFLTTDEKALSKGTPISPDKVEIGSQEGSDV